MHVGLHDSDKTGFPNLALMKIAAWHKAQGDIVEWWTPMFPFDRVRETGLEFNGRLKPYHILCDFCATQMIRYRSCRGCFEG